MKVKYLSRIPLTPKFSLPIFSTKVIISVGVFLRVLTLLLLPNVPSGIAPDEGTYAKLVSWLASGHSARNFPEFGDGLFRSSRLLIIPSIALDYLGLSSLNAVRVTSLAFSILNIVLFNKFLSSMLQDSGHLLLRRFILFIYVFLPSHFIWGTLGLRESINEFGILLTFYFLRKILNEFEGKRLFQIVSLIFGLSITFNIRPQVGLMLGFVLIFSILLNFWKQPLVVFFLFLFPILNFLAQSVPLGIPQVFESISSTSNTSNTSPTEVIGFIQDKREGNQQFANSKIEVANCINEKSRFTNLGCEIARLPSAVVQVTLRPVPIYDTGSSTQIAAGIENLVWMLLYVFILSQLKGLFRKKHFGFEIPATIFVALFTIAAGLYEGNVGTAFRHKGLLLSLLLLIAVSLYLERTPQVLESTIKKPRGHEL